MKMSKLLVLIMFCFTLILITGFSNPKADSICEIAMAYGFQIVSYFSVIFRTEMGLVPQD